MIKNFYDLRVWQDAHRLTLDIYAITKNFPKEELFGLVSQIRRSASSVPSNIAEGFGRFHYKDKIHFYITARASGVELYNHVLLSRDLNYITQDVALGICEQVDLVSRQLNGLIRKTGITSA